ncbi:TMV resistance protein N-like [Rutidosis leptorrhynchoides]|uniref:TMV resistance protein N-like n=1 Tax=Rutidosis leptorrhynchoides TaxID=125765 RepID=UPI003A9A64A0
MAEVPADEVNTVSNDRSLTSQWNQRLGHMSDKGMKMLVSNGKIPGLKRVESDFCESCVLGKKKKVTFAKAGRTLKAQKLELVHTDVAYDINKDGDKLDAKAKKYVFIGYGGDDMGYRLWDNKGKHVIRSKHPTFNEAELYKDFNSTTKEKESVEFEVDTETTREDERETPEDETEVPVGVPNSESSESDHEQTSDSGSSESDDEQTPQSPPQSDQSNWVRRSTRVTRQPVRFSPTVNYLLLTENGEPESYSEAMKVKDSFQWEQAMKSEMESLLKNQTWRLTKLPPGKRVLQNKWVFRVKDEGDVVKMTTIRLVLSMVATEKLHLEQLDVKTAFLHGDIEEDIYMSQPEGFRVKGKESLVCNLKRSLNIEEKAGTRERRDELGLALQKYKSADRLSTVETMSYESSSASSSIRVSKGYDVFLSFRGEDTRTASNSFTSHLYDALIRKCIRTYQDDKSLEIGNVIAPELLRAIEASKFAIVVLSPNFATSKWCLEEIVNIVNCMELGKLVVIPVFYHVSPTDVCHQSDCYVQCFTNHEQNPEIPPQKVETWKAAFKKLGAISGLHVTQDRKESEVVNEIVKKILTDMQALVPKSLPDGLVGIESRLNEVKKILIMESSDVRFIRICGMSGVGKTTLAEVVYEAVQMEFQESSFIENIKDISKERNTDLCKLQQKLLDDILKGESVPVKTVRHGQTLLKTKLRDLKVIIVLDDVNHADQLTYLAGGRECFGNGSRVIITTTNTDLLNPHRINATYVCEELEDDEALNLFCQSAFGGHPTKRYENLSKDIVKLACGLPLALNAYGSLLRTKEESYWKEFLNKLQENAHEEVFGRDTFRYIACFLKGRDKNLVKDILTDIGLYPECGITDLINKFLITLNHDDSVWMHDLLQQMCWEILRKDSERDYGKYVAIKRRQDIVDILSSKPKGMRVIEIINQEPYKAEEEVCFDDPTCFSKMTKLRFLRISNIRFSQGLNYLSNDLRILEWYRCSLKSFPSTFAPKHIFELDMRCSHLETLWEKDLDLPNLRSVNLSFSPNLIKIPNLTSTPKLRVLNLEGCVKLRALHESVLVHKRLRYMNLKGCGLLESLGGCNMEMDALEALHLSGCCNLKYIPEFGLNMKCLEHLYVDGTNVKKLPESLGKMCNLRKFDVSETSIEEIPSSIYQLKRLRFLRVHRCMLLSHNRGFLYTNLDTVSYIREVDLSYCNLSAVPEGIGLLCRIVKLDLSGNDFVLLPASISLLSNLKLLNLNNCKRLQSLPKLSIVNEETLYGLEIRFNYYISGEAVDFSRFHASSDNGSPTVSCLNCPRLAENESGRYLVDKILNSYLQLRTKYWITPAAVFEIVGTGSKIPSSFKLMTSGENVILEGPWIGVAICAVIAVHQIVVFMDANYTVTVHIHVGEKHWMIPVPINFLMARVENQLVVYWTVTDDYQRIVDLTQQNNFRFSFSVGPGDGNVEVTKFGVRFIREGDTFEPKRHEDSTSMVALQEVQGYIRACEADIDRCPRHSAIHDHTIMTTKFLHDYGKQQYSLDDIHKILKCVTEITQQVFGEYKEEWRHSE